MTIKALLRKQQTCLFEDESILVLNKPAGITVNRSETTRHEETVQDWLEKRLKTEKLKLRNRLSESDFYKRAGIVHRLDKETSGILLVAKDEDSFMNLQKQFKERMVKKTYLALTHGKIKVKEGEIKVPVGRLPWNRKRFGILAGGRESVTEYKVLNYFISKKNNSEFYSLVELYPKTGRTHQIRVHLKFINHPIFSDFLYAGRKTAREDRKILKRVFLHASKISFSHPKSGERMAFESPLPPDLSKTLQQDFSKI
ncbi:MAG: hypothetical protein A2W22_02130 [Candidatus Levybacteria bacterium RBG_16_35_11]|nr:MAG: hypothetical protein A2W22_02130 [Candidatus Levybacteria bacterium RBG_16_35_11]